MTMAKDVPDTLPPFDPKSKCAKCGWEIPDPPPPEPKLGPKGKDGAQTMLPAGPPPPPIPPNVQYCNGEMCPWMPEGVDAVADEHMHQFCDTCGYEWLTKPLG